jgi:hypothetical protein
MITIRQIAYMDGRRWTLDQARKPSEKRIAEACPFEYTQPGTPDKDKKGENGRRTAWLAGATEARADHVGPASLKKLAEVDPANRRHPRAQSRHEYQQRAKLLRKGYTLAV